MTKTERFPVDWTVWHGQWRAWLAEQFAAGTLTRSSFRFPPKNMLADEVLGVYRVPGSGRTVELSEVTFPDLSGERRGERLRYVGITYGTGAGIESGGLAESFADLEARLASGHVDDHGGATL